MKQKSVRGGRSLKKGEIVFQCLEENLLGF